MSVCQISLSAKHMTMFFISVTREQCTQHVLTRYLNAQELLLGLPCYSEDQYLVVLTVNGYIKKVPLNVFSAIRSTGIISICLVPGDELKWVRESVFVGMMPLLLWLHKTGWMVIVNTCNKLCPLGRTTKGVTPMTLKGDKMTAMDAIPSTMHTMPEKNTNRTRDLIPPWLLFIAENGFGKRVSLNAFRKSGFNLVGLRGYKLPEDCCLAAVFVVGKSTDDEASDEQVVLVSQGGTMNRIMVEDIHPGSRGKGSHSDEAGARWEDLVSFTDICRSCR